VQGAAAYRRRAQLPEIRTAAGDAPQQLELPLA
jgi:hypothetical protein